MRSAAGKARLLPALPGGERSRRNWRQRPPAGVSLLGRTIGGVFLIPHPWIGVFIWIALLQTPRYAAFALLGVAAAEAIVRALRIGNAAPLASGLKCNALLAAVAAAWLTGSSGLPVAVQIAVGAASAVAAVVMTAAVTRALAGTMLPALVLGYCLVAAMLFAIFLHWTHAASVAMVWPLPDGVLGWVATFFRTLGAILFSPTPGVGLVVAAAVLLWSRIAFAAGVMGWIAGVAVAVAAGHSGVVFYWMPTAYNFFLSGMAVGAVFFLPGRASLPIAAAAGFGASVLAVALQHLFPATALGYLPVATLLTIWIALCALEAAEDQTIVQRNKTADLPPEEAWWRATYWSRRSGPEGPFLVVPVGGPARVAQGIDGPLSHVGPWRHALDFQGPAPQPPAVDVLGDATAWHQAVIAPAGGMVERVRNDVADNPLGVCNYADNWGNYVIIRLDQGGWALLAHLRQGSVVVQPGMRVELGAYLGRIGNSGRSPFHHLHLQAQDSPEPGAPTMPFRLANFLSAAGAEQPLLRWHPSALPEEGMIVAPAPANPRAQPVLSGCIPGSAVWRAEADGVIPWPFGRLPSAATMRVSVSLDAAGRYLFRGAAGGPLLAAADADAWRVLDLDAGAPPLFTLLALAVPSIPYAVVPGMSWEEIAPVGAFRWPRWLGLALSPYLREPFVRLQCRCISVPEGPDGPLVIEARPDAAWRWLPSSLPCQFSGLRGPTRLEAVFPDGVLTYGQLSFEPGLPQEDPRG